MLKIGLLQCYEALWIHNIDAICSSSIYFEASQSVNNYEILASLEIRSALERKERRFAIEFFLGMFSFVQILKNFLSSAGLLLNIFKRKK